MLRVTKFILSVVFFKGYFGKFNLNLDILTGTIEAGGSLTGTTFDNLQEKKYSVAVAGSIIPNIF